MKLRVLGCSGGSVRGRHLSCFLLNDAVALDAGSLAPSLPLDEQRGIGHVVLTHAHLDHHGGLPFFIDNVFGHIDEPVVVYATDPVVDGLERHIFNDVIWPDFTRLPSPEKPTLRFQRVEVEKSFAIGSLSLTPVPVHHLTPTVGFLVEEGSSAIVHTSDTGPTDRVWELASRHASVRAIITEISFANEDDALARASGHMTPDMLAGELRKMTREVPVLITHTKPGHVERIRKQLDALGLEKVELLEEGREYTF